MRHLPRAHAAGYYFVWLLGGLGLMSGTGYLLFSGFSGLGDLGMEPDGALRGATPQWLWRLGLIAVGARTYLSVVRYLRRRLTAQLPSDRAEQLALARRVSRISYLTGALAYLFIGAFNPHGFDIVVLSVLPSSLGASCGLLWMWSSRRAAPAPAPHCAGPGLYFARSRGWLAVAAALTLAYGVLLGPSRVF